jgi:hypothetical protein
MRKNEMKTNDKSQEVSASNRSFKQFCESYCRKLVEQLQQGKAAIYNEMQQAFGPEENVLRLALNEAEALAWETGYPSLVFPDLAAEKAQAAVAWERRQEAMEPGRSGRVFA